MLFLFIVHRSTTGRRAHKRNCRFFAALHTESRVSALALPRRSKTSTGGCGAQVMQQRRTCCAQRRAEKHTHTATFSLSLPLSLFLSLNEASDQFTSRSCIYFSHRACHSTTNSPYLQSLCTLTFFLFLIFVKTQLDKARREHRRHEQTRQDKTRQRPE